MRIVVSAGLTSALRAMSSTPITATSSGRRRPTSSSSRIITAGAVLATLPVVLLYIPVQKYVVSGLTSGAVKG